LLDLYQLIKAHHQSRISFQPYILIHYLQQILQIANQRLPKLSNPQFYLKPTQPVQKTNPQSALPLDVYDTYTPQT
ncbi:hypothetical protein, partial [Bacillus thuringiensis]|uniref:hypothetical protein n=1 Tax=Bacillus thuringiensis TaxID=1428 RepID=UPI001C92C8F2